MDEIKNKRILLFSQYFFGYEKKIAKKMEQMGAQVDCFDERSVESAFDRALLKVSSKLFLKKTEKYFEDILSRIKTNKYDYALFIDCEMASEKTIKEYKRAFPNAKFCLHLWDSVANLKGVEKKFYLFDHITSFDNNDCEVYNLNSRPLFFSDEYRAKPSNGDMKYDLAFIGTIHSDRYAVINKITNKYPDYRMYIYPYLQSKFIYYYYKITKREFNGTKKADFFYTSLKADDIASIIDSSIAVIDIQHPKQTGLTMRTLEMLGMKKKFITTNSDIMNYDFYDSNNICIIDRTNPVIDSAFLETDYKEIDEEIYEHYSIDSWILNVLGITI